MGFFEQPRYILPDLFEGIVNWTGMRFRALTQPETAAGE
jgi:hypothetical protein